MNKKGLILTLAVAVVIAVVAYIAGSVNKNNDQIAAENTNTKVVSYTGAAIQGTNIELELPDTFSICPESSEFFPGLVAYVWRIDDCANTQDAPDMQIFVQESTSPESVLRAKASVFFENNPEASVEEKTINGVKIFFAGTSADEYFVAKQLNERVIFVSANRMELFGDQNIVDQIIVSATVN